MKLKDGRLVRLTESGEITAIEQTLRLKVGDQFITETKFNPSIDALETRHIITAEGFSFIAATMGLTIITPETIVSDDGTVVGNPHIERSRGIITNVRQRVICFGRGTNGTLMATDLTFVYNLGAYLHTDLLNKFLGWEMDKTSKKAAGKKWGKLVSHADPCEPGKIRVPVAVEGLELEVDANHADVLLIWREYQEKQKFAERACHSMAVRNVVRKFTGLQFCEEDGSVTVTCWADIDRDLEKLSKTIQQTKLGKVVVDGEVVSIQQAVDSDETPSPPLPETVEAAKDSQDQPEEESPPAPTNQSDEEKLAEVKAKVRAKMIASGFEKKSSQYPPLKNASERTGMSITDIGKSKDLGLWEGILASIVD